MRKYLAIILLSILLTACGSKPPTLEGAIHPDAMPVYPGAQLDPGQALAGADMSGDNGAFYARYWDLKTTDSRDKVLAWYKTKMPQAKVEDTPNIGLTTLTWDSFPGAEAGEYIAVTLDNEQTIHISECLKAGKHKKS